ncbi:MAG: L,D-transpeptidase family protein [Alphaproteobacteria bacterium]|uniref:L,D-transpeptidase family protein n=1 Tax=Candidatus Nitrobium versatile TaxID=2884831 RepID=A0A953M385_9BACT|nr:L,D-transpeptidase family protein [Candidatus Nitrobium versatile]
MIRMLLSLAFMALFPLVCHANLTGDITMYHVVQGDTIEGIGAKLGVKWSHIVEENRLDTKSLLRIGQKLRVNTIKIIPKIKERGILINVPDKMLYFFKERRLEMAFPVGLGMPVAADKTDWRTPVGLFEVRNKQKNPKWFVPKSIQQEMAREGKPVEKVISPGPDNPLGRHVIRTSLSGIEIHETIWPTSVYQFRSHGCVRMLPEHMEKLFKEVEIATPGEIIYVPVKFALSDRGRYYLEVHRDIYRKGVDLGGEARRLIEKAGAIHRVDWKKVEKIVREKKGIAEDITL